MKPETEKPKLQQLEKLLCMMALCHRYLEADKKAQQNKFCHRWPALKAEAEKRVDLRTRALTRLQAYYAKKCFGLYLASLQGVSNERPTLPLKLSSDAGWNPEGVRLNNELLIYGAQRDLNAIRA